jgi:hypothetical protein
MRLQLLLLLMVLIGTFAYPPPGRLEDLPINDENDGQRDVECGASGKDLIGNVLTDEAALLDVDSVQEFGVFPTEQRRNGYNQRNSPDEENLHP